MGQTGLMILYKYLGKFLEKQTFSSNLYQAFTAIVPDLLASESFFHILKISVADLNELIDTKQP